MGKIKLSNQAKKMLAITAITGAFALTSQNSYSVVASEATQLLILSETAQQTVQQVQQLETAIKQKEAQLMELVSLPQATFNEYRNKYNTILGQYKSLINRYKNSAKNIRNMTARMKNYNYNPTNLVKTLDDTMQMTNGVIQSNMEALNEYQRQLQKEAKEMSPQKQAQEVKNIKNVQQGVQTLTHKFVSLNTALSRMTQMIINNDLEDKAAKQAQYYIRRQQENQFARETAGFRAVAKGFDEAKTKVNKKLKSAPKSQSTNTRARRGK